VDLPISFSSAGSSDPDGMIVDYLWEFGDGSTSTDPNPAYAYASAAEFSVSLTVTDDFGDSHTSTTRANVSPPVIAEPDIQIDTSALDFNQVEIGTTATLAATVHNNGTELLSISGVMACAGTSSEYDWSPSTFDIEPGGSTALSVMYAPSDDLSDSGCLEIMSNDPDEGTLALGINGTGFVPAPVVADLDINRLSSSKRARLGQRRQISVSLVVTNSGLDAASANATLTATQNGIVVHEEQSMLDVAAGDQTRINFRAFTPTDSGDIEWSVSIDDEDPDVDQASAVTHLVTPKSPRSGRGNR
jgi:PKD repeat protein